jgi:hypothetical protein
MWRKSAVATHVCTTAATCTPAAQRQRDARATRILASAARGVVCLVCFDDFDGDHISDFGLGPVPDKMLVLIFTSAGREST